MRFLPVMAAMAAVAQPAAAAAETLADAIAAAYSSNPRIAAARAQVRQVDETAVLATVPTRPTLSGSGQFVQGLTEAFGDLGRTWSAGATLRQAIWEGGRVRASLGAAEARILSARASLAAIEQQVIVETVAAYADVLRTAEIVRLNENQVRVLGRELQASRDRFEVGDVTRTDVAQSEARLALAQANLENARGLETVAAETYRQLVGRLPAGLAPLPPLPALPASADEARTVATESNPDLVAARLAERAAERDVAAAKRERAPSIGLSATAQYTRNEGTPQGFNFSGFNPQLGVSANIPLFTGGLIASQVRQAQARQSQQLELISQTERQVTAAATGGFAQLQAANAVIQSAKVQVSANALAAEGVRQENQVGSRDILDVLNAEQELLNSRVQLVTAERDQYVLAYQLLAAVGRADVALEGAPVERYDPAVNARRVRGMGWQEFGIDADPRASRARNEAPLVGPRLEPQP